LESALGNSVLIGQGEAIAEIRVLTDENTSLVLPIRAGIHTAEWAWDRPDLLGRIAHRRAPIVRDFPIESGAYAAHVYRATLPLGRTVNVRELEIVSLSGQATLVVDRFSLADSGAQRATDLRMRDFLAGSRHYREVWRSENVVVFENPTALPRAWVVDGLTVLPPEAIRGLLLGEAPPTGEPFDPRRRALVEPAVAERLPSNLSGRGEVHVGGYAPGRIEMEVSADSAAFVVVSETYYPGWRLSLDGAAAPLHRANHSLMGFAVPPGRHTAELWYDPRVFLLGLLTTAAAIIVGLLSVPRLVRALGPGVDSQREQ
jgi:hypothetical protein